MKVEISIKIDGNEHKIKVVGEDIRDEVLRRVLAVVDSSGSK